MEDNSMVSSTETEQVVETTQKTQIEETQKEKMYSRSEVNKMLSAERSKMEEKYAQEKSEAEKLAKMKEDERKEYEFQKERKEKEEAKAELNAYKLKDEAIKMANAPETQVDVSLLNLIDFKTIKAEQVEETIKNIKIVFDSAVENEVNNRLKETTPKTVFGSNNESTKSNISRASY